MTLAPILSTETAEEGPARVIPGLQAIARCVESWQRFHREPCRQGNLGCREMFRWIVPPIGLSIHSR